MIGRQLNPNFRLKDILWIVEYWILSTFLSHYQKEMCPS